ncbi:hypothetical protein ES705_38316 [subsurface metagenome]
MTNVRFPKYFPVINLYLFILGKTMIPVLSLNSEHIIPEKKRQTAMIINKELDNPP